MASHTEPLTIEEELAKLEEACRKIAQDISNSRSIRETVGLAVVEVPHHLIALAYTKVPTLGRLARLRDLRVEEIVKNQLSSLDLEQNELVASRELDRFKANDWHVLRANYPDLYAKTFREANLILERKRNRNRRH